MKPESRRVKMTKKVLCDSLIHLLFQKDIQHVTIKEICDYADINRSTYYRYYQNPFDQLNKIQEELIHELYLHIEKISKKYRFFFAECIFKLYIQHD